MKRNRIIGLAAAALAVFLTTGAQAADKLRLGTEGAYPPFNYFDSAKNLTGFDVEIGVALCKEMGVECELVAQDWDGIIPGLVAKKYDFIIASMSITEERKKQVSFSKPYYLAALAHVAPKDSKFDAFTNDVMKDKIIGAQSGTVMAEFVQAQYPDAEVRLYPTQDEVNLDLANGRLDLVVGDLLPMLDWIKNTDDGKCCEKVGDAITDPKFAGDGIGIAVRKEDDDLRMALNKAIDAIRANGTYKKINDKYFDVDIYTMK